jgi:hypothetical protein
MVTVAGWSRRGSAERLMVAVAMAAGWWGGWGAAAAEAGPERIRLASPIRLAAEPAVAGADATVRAVVLDEAALAAVRTEHEMVLVGVPVGGGRSVDVEAERFEVLTPDARVVARTAEGDREMARPDVVLLRGSVTGERDSRVFLALSPLGCNGWVEMGGARHILSAGRDGRPTVVYDLAALPGGLPGLRDIVCGGGLAAPAGGEPGGVPGDGLRSATCRSARVAVDGDFKYTSEVFGGNAAAAQAYIVTLAGAVSEIFRRDLGLTMALSFSRVWTVADPYPPDPVGGALLSGFAAYWGQEMASVPRNVAHLLTGSRPGGAGGIAWLGQACGGTYSYAVSGFINGSFPSPLGNDNGQNWDVLVMAHEVGHNFNALHTHEMTPPVDGCGTGNCSGANQGTIMSYCHTCSGGVANITLDFHPRNITEQMVPFMTGWASSCLQWEECTSRVINLNARTDCTGATAAVSVLLPAGTYLFKAVDAAGGGAYTAWSPSASNSGCGATCCTQGWTWSYQYTIAGQTTSVTAPACPRSTAALAFANLSQDRVVAVASQAVASLRVSDTNCSDNRGGVSLRIVRCPQVTANPGSQGWCAPPSAVTFTAAATGDDVAYRWRKDGQPLSNGGRVSGADGPSLVIAQPAAADAGWYDCVASNACGSVTTSAAFLSLSNGGPIVTSQPQGVTAEPGGEATLSVGAVGFGPVAIQWRREGVELSDGGAVSGAQTATLRIQPVQPADSGMYDAVLTDQCGTRVTAAARVDAYCAADWNRDHAITPADIAAFVNDWSASVAAGTLIGDADGNGVVNPSDVAVFVNGWFGAIGQAC